MAEEVMHPTSNELELLMLAYNRFFDLFDEIFPDLFWDQPANYRFTRIKEIFCVYSELLNYSPIKSVIEYVKEYRPPMEAEIASEFFSFIRNVIVHFPFFNTWEEIWITKDLINWYKEGLSIDRSLRKYNGHEPVKFMFWESDVKRMTYLAVTFPKVYVSGEKVFLKDMLLEKEGVHFSLILMKKILSTQIEEMSENH